MGALGVSTWQLLLLVMGKGPDQYCVGHFILALLGSETNVPSHLIGDLFLAAFQSGNKFADWRAKIIES